MPVIMGTAEYPDDIEGFLKREIGNVKVVDALEIAEELGNVKAVNTVLMGVLAKELPFDREEWLAQIEKTVKPRFVELNKKAFMRGYEL